MICFFYAAVSCSAHQFTLRERLADLKENALQLGCLGLDSSKSLVAEGELVSWKCMELEVPGEGRG